MPTPERRVAGAHICVPRRRLWWFVAMGVLPSNARRVHQHLTMVLLCSVDALPTMTRTSVMPSVQAVGTLHVPYPRRTG